MVGQDAGRDHHAARMNAQVVRLPDQRVRKAHGLLLPRILQLGQHLLGLRLNSPPGIGVPRIRQQAYQPVERLVTQSKRLARFSHRRPQPQRADRRHQRHVLLAIRTPDILQHVVAPPAAEIEVDVGQPTARRVEKTLKQQVVRERIDRQLCQDSRPPASWRRCPACSPVSSDRAHRRQYRRRSEKTAQSHARVIAASSWASRCSNLPIGAVAASAPFRLRSASAASAVCPVCQRIDGPHRPLLQFQRRTPLQYAVGRLQRLGERLQNARPSLAAQANADRRWFRCRSTHAAPVRRPCSCARSPPARAAWRVRSSPGSTPAVRPLPPRQTAAPAPSPRGQPARSAGVCSSRPR